MDLFDFADDNNTLPERPNSKNKPNEAVSGSYEGFSVGDKVNFSPSEGGSFNSEIKAIYQKEVAGVQSTILSCAGFDIVCPYNLGHVKKI